MASLLISGVTICDSLSDYHNQTADILFRDGILSDIGRLSVSADHHIEAPGLHISPGWIDFGLQGGEPGLEHRETRDTLLAAAARGGMTRIYVWPSTTPVIDQRSILDHVQGKDPISGITLGVIAAATRDSRGRILSEMMDLADAGAVAFSDGQSLPLSAGVLLKALQYSRLTGCPIIQSPVEPGLIHGQSIHEGSISTELGLRGDPSIGEHIALRRDIELQGYAGGKLISHLLSSAGSVDIFWAAAQNNPHLKASISALHLISSHEDVRGFNALFKSDPPLREKSDLNALREAVQKNKIQAIVSAHQPWDEESWDKEYSHAPTGQTGVDILYPLLRSYSELSDERIVHILSHGNRETLGLAPCRVMPETPAEFTLYRPDEKWEYTADRRSSLSRNTPFIDRTLQGQVYGTLIGEQLTVQDYR